MSGSLSNVGEFFCVIQLSGILERSNKRSILKAAKSKSINGWTVPTRSYRQVWMSMNRITNQNNVSVGLPSPSVLSGIEGHLCGIGYYHTRRVVASSEPQTHPIEGLPQGMRDTLSSKDIMNTNQVEPWDVTAIKKYFERAQSNHSSEGNGNKPNQVVKDCNSLKQGAESGISRSLKAGSQESVRDKGGIQELEDLLKDDKKSGIYHNLIDIIANERFLIGCYNDIKGKPGNMTKGYNEETLDGIKHSWMRRLSKDIKGGKFKFSPVRRVMIPKPKGGMRPLGVGNPREKIIQKAMTVILEGIWEPLFSDSSHGFRPRRSCHTALREVYLKGNTYRWVIQGDISKCFDKIPHEIIIREVERKVKCKRTIELIKGYLRAGYIEKTGEPERKGNFSGALNGFKGLKGLKNYNNEEVVRTKEGVPQGGILSPLLSNIVLHKLDMYMERLKKRFDKGSCREQEKEYVRINGRMRYYRKIGREGVVRVLRKKRDNLKGTNQMDDKYKRLMYVRYADDFIVLVSGTLREARIIRDEIKNALKVYCGAELNTEKSIITRTTNWYSFIGATIRNARGFEKPYNKTKVGIRRRQNVRTLVGAPIKEILRKLEEVGITKKGVGTRLKFLVYQDYADIIKYYNRKMMGIANYYRFACNYSRLGIVAWRLKESCALTLASKYKLNTKAKAFAKFGGWLKDPETGIKLWNFREGHKREFKRNFSIDHKSLEVLIKEKWMKFTKSGFGKVCAICGEGDVEMHHVRKVNDVRMKFKRKDLTVGEFKGAILRKQVPLCKKHHRDLHAGRLSEGEIEIIKNYGRH